MKNVYHFISWAMWLCVVSDLLGHTVTFTLDITVRGVTGITGITVSGVIVNHFIFFPHFISILSILKNCFLYQFYKSDTFIIEKDWLSDCNCVFLNLENETCYTIDISC